MKMEMKMKNRSHRYDIRDLSLRRDTHIVNIKSVFSIAMKFFKVLSQKLFGDSDLSY